MKVFFINRSVVVNLEGTRMKVRKLVQLSNSEIYRYFKDSSPERLYDLFNLEAPEMYIDQGIDIDSQRKILKKSGYAIICTESFDLEIRPSKIGLICPGRSVTAVYKNGEFRGLIVKDKTIIDNNGLRLEITDSIFYTEDES